MPFDAAEIRRIMAELNFPPGSALLHAGAALVLHGLTETASDIDIATNEAGWRHALTLGAPRAANIDELIEPLPGVEVFSGWLGEPLAGLFARALEQDGVLLAAPEDILAFKRRLNRPKDQAHIRLLEAHTCNNH